MQVHVAVVFCVLSLALSGFLSSFFNMKSMNAALNDSGNIIYMKLKDDSLVAIELLPEVAPKHVARVKELTRAKFYDGSPFFRVINDFIAQTGDPTGTGMGGSGRRLDAEFSKVSFKRGIVGMARAADPNSADSQFFIVLKDSVFLDGKYTVFGRVISGMENVDRVKKSKTGSNGIVAEPDVIVSMAIASDVEKAAIIQAKNAKNNLTNASLSQ